MKLRVERKITNFGNKHFFVPCIPKPFYGMKLFAKGLSEGAAEQMGDDSLD